MDDFWDLLSPDFLNRIRSFGKGEWTLSVYASFPAESAEGYFLAQAQKCLEKSGISIRSFYESRENLNEALRGRKLLAFVDSVSKTGRLALCADALDLSGAVVYGMESGFPSLEGKNVITSFGNGRFCSCYTCMSDFAFPVIGDSLLEGSLSVLNDREIREVVQILTGLMIFSLNPDIGILPAMDQGRSISMCE